MQEAIGPKMSTAAGVWCQPTKQILNQRKAQPSKRIPKFYPHLLVLLVLHLARASDLATSCNHTPAKKLRSCISTLHIRPQLATLPAFAGEKPRWNNNQGNQNKHGSVTVQFWQQAILGCKKTLKNASSVIMKLQQKAILRAHNRSMVPVHLFELWMCGTLFSNLKGTCFVSKRRARGKTKARNDIHWKPLTDIFWIMSLSTSLRAWRQSLLTKY